jgi:hypothetical protein
VPDLQTAGSGGIVMSQHTARHDPHAKSRDEDVDDVRARQPEHREGVQPRQPAGRPAGDGVGQDGPEEEEFELIGDDDLGAADLGPLGPHADPDAPWAKPRRMPPKNQQ